MRVVIIGGGAAGMMAAFAAKKYMDMVTSSDNDEVILIEKNEKLGKKIFITGKGRGNITNNCDKEMFFSNIIRNPKFFNSAFSKFSNIDTMNFFTDNGLKIKTERGNRVFPELDKAFLITDTFIKVLNRLGVKILLNAEVTDIINKNNKVKAIVCKDLLKNNGSYKNKTFHKVKEENNGKHFTMLPYDSIIREDNKLFKLEADKIIIATGGKSYSRTGSTGDGYKFAEKFEINVKKTVPALVPLKCIEVDDLEILKGLKLKNITIKIHDENNKLIYKDFGELYFEKEFLDGPVIRKASSIIDNNLQYKLSIDLKPALDDKTLDKRLIREIENKNNTKVIDLLKTLLPNELGILFLKKMNFDLNSNINLINKEIRFKLLKMLKCYTLTICGDMGFDYAIITRGGVDVNEINPRTMESKKVKGLFFAGEVIDIDAFTGGFNMQIAFSTGYLAGITNVI